MFSNHLMTNYIFKLSKICMLKIFLFMKIATYVELCLKNKHEHLHFNILLSSGSVSYRCDRRSVIPISPVHWHTSTVSAPVYVKVILNSR